MSRNRPNSAPAKRRGGGEPGILLGRNSSARSLIKKKSSSSLLDTQDEREILLKGGTPHEEALVVMQMVYEGCGKDPSTVAGLSTLDKLQSFRTEPALDILKNTTWRNFFVNRNNNQGNNNNDAIINHMRPKSASAASKLNRSIPQISKNQKTLEEQQRKLFDNISSTFDRMISRVEMLWNALNLPESDRLFYKQSLCKGPPSSMDHCREVAQYISMLQIHRKATINVLKSIESREVYVKRCYDVIAALSRKSSRRDNHSSLTDDSISLWRQELIISLKDVQVSSLNVIQNIQIWRRNLWRPQPFMWKGADGITRDYLLKMKSDMNVLDSAIYAKQLKACGLSIKDLVCIVFELKEKDDNDIQLDSIPAQEIEIQKYKKILNERVDLIELQQAVHIVLNESNIRTALSLEAESLLAKGVFIPTLKLTSHDGAQQQQQQQQQQQHEQQQQQQYDEKYESKYDSFSPPPPGGSRKNSYDADFYNN